MHSEPHTVTDNTDGAESADVTAAAASAPGQDARAPHHSAAARASL